MEPSILRILDANANRAREGLRVMEDYARFYLNNDDLCGQLKRLRHDLASATASWVNEAVLFRDTPGDVGTTTKTSSEFERQDVAAVVIAAGKRLGEALRTLEEYLKTVSTTAAAAIEKIRYRFYDLEMAIARTLRPVGRFAGVGLYVLVTESICNRPWLEVAQAAIEGGADCLQLREKDLDAGELLQRAKVLTALCHQNHVLSIINDRPDIALLANADGVHVGQGDLPPVEARKILGPDKIVGVSTHNLAQAKQAVLDGADYIGVGPVFRSSTKTREIIPGLEFAKQASEQITLSTVAIAGITEENIELVRATGVRAVALTAAICASSEPLIATRRLKGIWSLKKSFEPQKQIGGADILVCPEQPSISPPASQSSQALDGGVDILVCPQGPSESQFHSDSRRLPHWRLEGATYFITFRILNGEFRPIERTAILEHIRAGDPKFYTLIAAVVMPDHVHLLLRPAEGVDLSRIMKGTKGATARKVNDLRNVRGSLWQDECWDRIMRNQSELDEKIAYCMNNPVKKGLVKDPWEYSWWFYRPHRD